MYHFLSKKQQFGGGLFCNEQTHRMEAYFFI